jgi:hypothetical protein
MDEIRSQIQFDSDQELEELNSHELARYSIRQLPEWEARIDFSNFKNTFKKEESKTD